MLVSAEDILLARETDPTHYLESRGFTVRSDGRLHLSVRDGSHEIARATLMADGHYVSCDKYENGIGDNIKLVQHVEPGLSFPEAVSRLVGISQASPIAHTRTWNNSKSLNLPTAQQPDIASGRKYLTAERHISLATVLEQESQGALNYGDGFVLFIGRDDQGKPMCATRRYIGNGEKRDIYGSDKSFPCIINGSPETVWIVEGGVDALALVDLHKRKSLKQPTVIVSGGVNVRSFLQTAHVAALLSEANTIFVAKEREKNKSVSDSCGAAHEKLMRAINKIATRTTVQGYLPPKGKDLAEYNAILATGGAK